MEDQDKEFYESLGISESRYDELADLIGDGTADLVEKDKMCPAEVIKLMLANVTTIEEASVMGFACGHSYAVLVQRFG